MIEFLIDFTHTSHVFRYTNTTVDMVVLTQETLLLLVDQMILFAYTHLHLNQKNTSHLELAISQELTTLS